MSVFALGNVPDAKRCQARSRRSGDRCRNPAANNTRVCRMHGAGTLAAKGKAARAKAEQRYAGEARRYGREQVRQGLQEGPVGVLESELGRSLGVVRHLESLVAVMADDQLAWGLNEADLRAAGVRARDVPTILAQQRGKPHPLIELLHRERTHLTRLISISLNNGVPEKQRAMDVEQVDLVERAINAVVRALGHTPSAPETRASILAALRSL